LFVFHPKFSNKENFPIMNEHSKILNPILELKLSDNQDDNEDKNSDFIVVWQALVQPLTDVQRLIFLFITIFVVIVAVVGNILVIYVNFSRFEF
jgi:hypothetical protein